MPRMYFIGVDVGTGSCRAALVSSQGRILKTFVRDIKIWNPSPDHYEQSSDDIWSAVCECVQEVTRGVAKHEIIGIGLDATCSLVVLDKSNNPLSVSTTRNDQQNIILWMDHRAHKEADFINDTHHELLQYVGGKISLEMELPKLLWLKKNLFSRSWSKIGTVFDLPDFLTYKCTGTATRSICSVVCKWNYDAKADQWSTDFLEKINLSELAINNFITIGSVIQNPGDSVGNGLSVKAAEELGLLPNTAVGTSMIDAHAGALALLGCNSDGISNDFTTRMAIICGTSSCHMSLTKEPLCTLGVWGPYKNALLQGLYLNEAGQSATGILIDYIIKTHPAYDAIVKHQIENSHQIYEYLNDIITMLSERNKLKSYHELSRDIHIWPDFHGNRTPLADPNLKGMISGLTMSADEENLAIIYLAVIQSLAYGTKHIVQALIDSGRQEFQSILICGGLSKNKLFVQTHADVCSLPVLLPGETEAVLLGSAMLAACAAKVYPDLESAAREMGGKATLISPSECDDVRIYHDKKYKVFLKMVKDQKSYEDIMN